MTLPAIYYSTVFDFCLLALCLMLSFSLSAQTNGRVLAGSAGSSVKAAALAIIGALFIGFRPLSSAFGDMVNYNHIYAIATSSRWGFEPDFGNEWGWEWLMRICGDFGIDYLGFCAIVAFLYFGFTYWGCRRLAPKHAYTLLIFILSAFSFFTYGTNGIRNGLGCAIIICALGYVCGSRKERLLALLLCILAYSVHHSTALPALSMFVSYYLIKSPKWCIAFWFLSIAISLVVGGAAESFFAGLGFDDRMSDYIAGTHNETYMQQFSRTGFRWDFLLYSFMPILLGWHIVMRRRIADRTYIVLLNTYILSNAFWVMLIRASFSNRFAYLSWFMYGVVLAYPLLKIEAFRRQGLATGLILLAQMAFTIYMLYK